MRLDAAFASVACITTGTFRERVRRSHPPRTRKHASRGHIQRRHQNRLAGAAETGG